MTSSLVTRSLVCAILLQIILGGSTLTDLHSSSPSVEADVGVVAADHKLCSKIGVDILKKGGNAIDSAVATAFCQGVTSPVSSGIGGGDFMLVRLANGHAMAFDFRETAPSHASENMYYNDLIKKEIGGLSVAIPGEVKGLYLVWRKYGKLPWKSLVEPAIRLSRDGFPIERFLALQIQLYLSTILQYSDIAHIFAPNGVGLVEGDILVRKKLAETLTSIAEQGSDALYTGPIAKALAEDVQAVGGILTVEDLANYRVKVRKPLVADIFGHTVIGFPPPSSGGAGLILILNILAAFKNIEAIKSDIGLHHIVEAFKHTYAVRSHLGDPAFVNVTGVVNDMLSPDFAAMLQKTILDNTTFGPEHYGGKYNRFNQGNEHGTSHLSVVDGDRNAVSMTCTVNYVFGSFLISKQTGILLNNEMDDFSTPQDDITYGPPPSVNFIQPKKRALSTMSPTIILKDGQLKAVVGGSGGVKILTTVAQVVLNMLVGYEPSTAVTLPRVHHQLLPNVVHYENYTALSGLLEEIPDSTRQFLIDRRHVLTNESSGAVSQFIVHDLERYANLSLYGNVPRDPHIFLGKLIGVSDLRKGGYPWGY